MSKNIEIISARLETQEDGAKVLRCGVPGCCETLATVKPPRQVTVRQIGRVEAEGTRQEEAALEVGKRFQEMSRSLWGDPNSLKVPPTLKSHYLANERAQRLRLVESRAQRREESGSPTVERQWQGIKKTRSRRFFNEADLKVRPIYIMCPLHGVRNRVESVS